MIVIAFVLSYTGTYTHTCTYITWVVYYDITQIYQNSRQPFHTRSSNYENIWLPYLHLFCLACKKTTKIIIITLSFTSLILSFCVCYSLFTFYMRTYTPHISKEYGKKDKYWTKKRNINSRFYYNITCFCGLLI